MNWTWVVRTRDGGMNGLEFARCTTAGGFRRVLVHAAPAQAQLEVRDEDDGLVARADVDREGDYSPMTLIELEDGHVRRREVWPDESFHGTPVLLAGGEAGILQRWEHDEGRTWWRWSLELSNHTGRPSDWAPPTQSTQG